VEPDHQSAEADGVILGRARRLLGRLKPAAAVAEPVVTPPRRWSEELGDAGTTADAWVASRLAHRRLHTDVASDTIERLRQQYPARVEATIAQAERVLRHEFDLLGSGAYTPIDDERTATTDGYRPIDWYLDPIAHSRFPRGVELSAWDLERMRPGRADIKLPWELARCQHWAVLGQAYRLTGDDRYAVEIARELRDFMDANPIGTAVNWACTMDVALRAVSWAVGLELVRSCPALGLDFWRTAYEALFDHGAFIEGHLENTYEVTSNHFLSNVVGLFFLSAVFCDLPRGRTWDRRCRSWLIQELRIQVLPDGADYESSVPYHRFVTEMFLGSIRLADCAGEPLPESFTDEVQRMMAFLAAVLRPDGLMPQVGDADDGRLHVLSEYGHWRPQDASHLFGAAASVFRNGAWLAHAGESGRWESEWWGLDPAAVPSVPPSEAPAMRHFPQAGLTVMRPGRDYLLITNGMVGTAGFGNHKHNDLLAFEYHVDGQPVIVDPGSYVYTSDPAARNLFRSTMLHSTLSVDGEEQNEIRPEWLFRMFEKAHPEHLAVREDADTLEYRGRHGGYTRLTQPVRHERTFRIRRSDRSLVISDMLEGYGTHSLRWHFHFAPGVTVEKLSSDAIHVHGGPVSVRMTLPPQLTAAIAPGWYSPSYGVRQRCTMVDLDAMTPMNGRCDYTFRLTPQ
jgi:hypothetical protein